MLDSIQKALALGIAQTAWATDYELRGEKVAKFRRYIDGEHDADMTPEMRRAMRISSGSTGSPFNSNKCDDVIQTMVDRLTVDRIEGDTDAASEWAAEVLDYSRFDGLQIDNHEATLRDADSYLLVQYDEDDDLPYFCHELAWDGMTGMLVVYKQDDKSEIACAIKVWSETLQANADTLRVNYYYPDRIEKYIAEDGGQLTKFIDPLDSFYGDTWPIPWTETGRADGEPLGVPVIPFRNKARGKGGFGSSELENVIPLQDAANRTHYSMVMAAEVTAFAIYLALGFTPPADLTPGKIITVTGEGGAPLTKDQVADFKKLEGSSLEPFIKMAEYFNRQIEDVSRTPSMNASANLSGEAMKQSEIKLLGKVRRFQVKAGNGYEDAMMMAHRIQAAYGTQSPPEVTRWRTYWMDAEIRNDKDMVDNVMKVKDQIGPKETLRQLSPVFGWDEESIDRILAESQAAQAAKTNSILGINQFTQ